MAPSIASTNHTMETPLEDTGSLHPETLDQSRTTLKLQEHPF